MLLMLISCDDSILNQQGLEFYPTDDGSYVVSVGNAKYLSEIVIPKRHRGKLVTGIADGAFSGSTNLTSITIPSSIKKIGMYAFSGCKALTEINFNATAVDDFEGSNSTFGDTMNNKAGITVNIGANVTRIPDHLF